MHPQNALIQRESLAQVNAPHLDVITQLARRSVRKIRPSAIMYARSVTVSVSRTLWSVTSTPIPLAFRSKMIFCSSSTAIGSMPLNGSFEQYKIRLNAEGPGNLHSPPLAA